jgi:hypothetical protein
VVEFPDHEGAPRAGIGLRDMTEPQRKAAMAVDGDEAQFGKDLYFISILGTPSEKTRPGCCNSAGITWR